MINPTKGCGCSQNEETIEAQNNEKTIVDYRKIKRTFVHILIIFAIFSIGFALGKNSVIVKNNRIQTATNKIQSTAKNEIIVYYLHSTFRCKTCNNIEKMTTELLAKKYHHQLNNNKILFQSIDFQKDTELAQKFAVVASCVVIAKVNNNGEITAFKRLDKVWTLMNNPQQFNNYIANVINGYLPEVK